jgi:hypothetical protein
MSNRKTFEELTEQELEEMELDERYIEQYHAHEKFQSDIVDLVNSTNYESHFAATTLIRIGVALLRTLEPKMAENLIKAALEIDEAEVKIHWRNKDEDQYTH